MLSLHRQRGQVLIAIFLGSLLFGVGAASAALLLTGQPPDDLRKSIKKIVADSPQRDRMLDALEHWKDEAKAQQKLQDSLSDDLLATMQRHDAKRTDFDALFARADALNVQSRDALLDLRYALRADLDAEQWQTLFAEASTAVAPK